MPRVCPIFLLPVQRHIKSGLWSLAAGFVLCAGPDDFFLGSGEIVRVAKGVAIVRAPAPCGDSILP